MTEKENISIDQKPTLFIWVGENPPSNSKWLHADPLDAVNMLDTGLVEGLSLGREGSVVLKVLDKMIDAGRCTLPRIEFHTSSSVTEKRLGKMRSALEEKWKEKLN